MRTTRHVAACLIASSLAIAPVQAGSAAIDAMREYMGFANYEAGIILPQQITKEMFASIAFIDTRSPDQFAKGTIPGAINIEWRQVLDRMDDIPKGKPVVLFCNTGTLSAQAAFALRVAGRDNVLVLQTGIIGWNKDAGYQPEAK